MSNVRYFTYIEKMIPAYEEIIEHNKTMVDLIVYRDTDKYDIKNGKDKRWKSDVFRFMVLRDNPYWIWVDADCKILKTIDFHMEPKPYFMYVSGEVEIALAIGNGCKKFFSDVCKAVKPKIGWAQDYIGSRRDEIKYVPKGYFKHFGLHKLR